MAADEPGGLNKGVGDFQMRLDVAVPSPSPEITGAARVERPGALSCTDVLLLSDRMRFI